MTHALVMLAWGVGLPLLFWHRFARLSRAYTWFAIAFVVVSVASHALLGECFFTTLARHLWLAAGGYRDGLPFTALLANTVAGIRPSRRQVVLIWEVAVLVTAAGSLVSCGRAHGVWRAWRERKTTTRSNQMRPT